jgi:hypothetical protein
MNKFGTPNAAIGIPIYKFGTPNLAIGTPIYKFGTPKKHWDGRKKTFLHVFFHACIHLFASSAPGLTPGARDRPFWAWGIFLKFQVLIENRQVPKKQIPS